MLTRERILEMLAANRAELERRKVRSIALFGSFARGEAGPESDVDVVVEFDDSRHPSLFDLWDLEEYLETLLGRAVDAVTLRGLRPRMRDDVAREAVHAFQG
jgi:predicted nucleotidyltransferase